MMLSSFEIRGISAGRGGRGEEEARLLVMVSIFLVYASEKDDVEWIDLKQGKRDPSDLYICLDAALTQMSTGQFVCTE